MRRPIMRTLRLAFIAGFALIPVALDADPSSHCTYTRVAAAADASGFGLLTFLNTQVGYTLLDSVQRGLLTAVLGAMALVGLPVLLAAGVVAAADLPGRFFRNGRHPQT